MATELQINAPEYCSDVVLAEKSPAMAQEFGTHGQAHAAPQSNQPNAWVAQVENVEFNGSASLEEMQIALNPINVPEKRAIETSRTIEDDAYTVGVKIQGDYPGGSILSDCLNMACHTITENLAGVNVKPELQQPQLEVMAPAPAPEPAPVNHFNRDFSGPSGPMGM